MTKPKVPGSRQDFSAATRRALTEVAEELFTEHGYAATSLDSIVAGARVTKGALYHHFSGKQDLFAAVLERIEQESARSIQQVVDSYTDPWDQAREGLRTFLGIVQQPNYRRIVIQEGPSVLGYERFRTEEERSTYGTVQEIVRSILAAGGWQLDDPMLRTFSRVFFGALNTAGASVAVSEDPEADSARVETAIGLMLAGIRQLGGTGADLDEVTASVLGVTSRT